ncbi:hypothetical protein TUM3794_21030 [Shewanella colwelliana]|uniref:Regulatory protein FmdB Zinc ribbon domain-containing protein n=1 Tax=Shewanella colwelliana TaxID=23 RepID=A0ABQ4P0V7_SHECO|nr:hypothetical protein TUM3794_21030 [Shewanella colwelliana]
MRFFTDPNFVVYDFFCDHCRTETSVTVHEDGTNSCNSCSKPVCPPYTYKEAKLQQEVSSTTSRSDDYDEQ